MCDVCHNNPCLPQCTNADEPENITYCTECGEAIYPGDDVYISENSGSVFCESCMHHTEWE